MTFMLVSEELPPIFRLIIKLMLASVTHVLFMAWYDRSLFPRSTNLH